MRKTLGIVVLVLSIVGLSAGVVARPTHAQTPPVVFCGTLSAEDCTLLTTATNNLLAAQSATVDLSFNFTATNFPDAPAPIVIDIAGTGAYSGTANFMNMTNMTNATDPQVIIDSLRTFRGQLTLVVTLPPEMAGGTMPGAFPNPLTIDLRLVDGVGYINFDAIPELAQQGLTGWGGIDLAGLLTELVVQQPDLFNQALGGGGIDPALLAELQNPDSMNAYATIARVDTAGTNVAQFQTTIDFNAFFAQESTRELLRQSIQNQPGSEQLTPEQIEEAIDISASLFQNSSVLSTVTVDPATSTVLSQTVSAVIDLSTLATTMGPALGDGSAATPEALPTIDPASVPVFSFSAAVNYSNINAAPEITAPEGAQIVDYRQLLGGGGMMTPPAASTADPNVVTATPAAGDPNLVASPEATVDVAASPEATLEVTPEATLEATP